MTAAQVVWHDAECGGYRADLPLWRALAAAADGPVLDVGAGTGRVALDLAAAGIDVVALDRDDVLLSVLSERARARGFGVATAHGDATDFALWPRRFAAVLAPMQLVQLLDAAGRTAFLRRAANHLAPGGVVACAVADALEGSQDDERTEPPLPDVREVDGAVFSSQVVAVRVDGDAFVIERLRQTVAVDGAMSVEPDVLRLHRVGADALRDEAAPVGLREVARHRVEATDEHVGSDVVVLAR